MPCTVLGRGFCLLRRKEGSRLFRRYRIRPVAETLEDFLHVIRRSSENGKHRSRGYEASAVIGAFGTRRRARLPLQERPDQIGEPFEDIHADRPLAQEAEAGELVERALECRIRNDRGAPGCQGRDQLSVARLVEAVVLERPEQRDELRRRRLQEGRHEDVVGPEADAVTAHRSARILIQRLHVVRHIAPEQHAEIFHELEGETLCKALQVFRTRQVIKRLQYRRDMMVHEALYAGDNMLAGVARQLVVRKEDEARTHDMIAGSQTRDRIAEPAHGPVRSESEVAVSGSIEARGPCLELERQSLLRCRLDSPGVRPLCAGNRRKPESGQLSNVMALHEDITIHTDFCFQHRILS